MTICHAGCLLLVLPNCRVHALTTAAPLSPSYLLSRLCAALTAYAVENTAITQSGSSRPTTWPAPASVAKGMAGRPCTSTRPGECNVEVWLSSEGRKERMWGCPQHVHRQLLENK